MPVRCVSILLIWVPYFSHRCDLFLSQVHTGPAAHLPKNNVTQMNEFDYCLIDDHASQCNIPHFVWSGRSDAKMPVAKYHSWSYRSGVGNEVRKERSMDALASVSNIIAARIKEVNRTFTTEGISVELFSAEGISPTSPSDSILDTPFRFDFRYPLPIRIWIPLPTRIWISPSDIEFCGRNIPETCEIPRR